MLAMTTASADDPVAKAKALSGEGQALLAKADFDGALRCFEQAAKTDPEELNHDIRAAILRRVIAMRSRLAGMEDGEKWLPMARALHAYYITNEVYSEALAIAQAMHEKQPSAETAVCLAQTYLATGKNAEAEQTLRGVAADENSPQVRVLLGIAIARQERADEARALLKEIKQPEPPSAQLAFDTARLCALVGDSGAAADALVVCFENTPPSRLSVVKAEAQEDVDLAMLRASNKFAAALKTESKVPESKCSSGTSCDKCPSRATCGSDKKDKEKE